MSEYIEREALVEKLGYKLTRVAGYIRREIRGVDLNAILSTLELCQIVRDFPAADVEPVKHGRWVQKKEWHLGRWVAWFECSECGEHDDNSDMYEMMPFCNLSNYCPCCGAKMDEVNE